MNHIRGDILDVTSGIICHQVNALGHMAPPKIKGLDRERKRQKDRRRMIIDGQGTKTVLLPLSQKRPPARKKKRGR